MTKENGGAASYRAAPVPDRQDVAFWDTHNIGDHRSDVRVVKLRLSKDIDSPRVPVQRPGPRAWPPTPHKFPARFDPDQEATGIVKSVQVRLSPYFEAALGEGRRGFRWRCEHVREFDQSFYVPLPIMDPSGDKIRNVVMMVNGLNEINYTHFAHYDRIGAHLASHGVGAILHPAPFHLNRAAYLEPRFRSEYERFDRRTKYPDSNHHRPLQKWPVKSDDVMNRLPHLSMLRRPESIFHCFQQVADELADQAMMLRGLRPISESSDQSFYKRLFRVSNDTRVTLLGYSLGGLQVLYAFLLRPDLFHRCILINSGASIQTLKTKPVRIRDDEWKEITDNVTGTDIPDGIERPSLLRDILTHRPFDDRPNRKILSDNLRRIFFATGGADIVSPSEHLSRFLAPEDAAGGMNILQISGLEHPLDNSPVYDRWFPSLMGIVEQFVAAPEASKDKTVDYGKFTEEFRSMRVRGKPWATYVRELDARKSPPFVSERDRNLDVSRILNELDSAGDRKKFLQYYFTSKRFFEDDSDLIRTLDREYQQARSQDSRSVKGKR